MTKDGRARITLIEAADILSHISAVTGCCFVQSADAILAKDSREICSFV
jgi:hypothetical protein